MLLPFYAFVDMTFRDISNLFDFFCHMPWKNCDNGLFIFFWLTLFKMLQQLFFNTWQELFQAFRVCGSHIFWCKIREPFQQNISNRFRFFRYNFPTFVRVGGGHFQFLTRHEYFLILSLYRIPDSIGGISLFGTLNFPKYCSKHAYFYKCNLSKHILWLIFSKYWFSVIFEIFLFIY